MYWADHNPPHFHATYGDFEVLIRINVLSVYSGSLPSRAFGLVIELALLHKEELLQNWKLITEDMPLKKIYPLN